MTLTASSITPEAQSGQRFHGHTIGLELVAEQPIHRHAAMLLALGANNKEVAEAVGVSATTVSNWLRQAWFQERVQQFLAERGNDLQKLISAEAFNSLVTMVELRDSPKVTPTVKAAICKDILDRHLGKPTQRVEAVAMTTSDDPVAEVARLEQENDRLRRQGVN